MCEYCIQHGGGKKWYLNAKNYLRNYETTDRRRRVFVNDFVEYFMDKYDLYLKTNKKNLAMGDNDPSWIKRLKYNLFFKYQHAGQVIPHEEAKLVIDIAGQISLLPCVCRFANSGEKHQLCMLFMHIPDDLYGAHRFDRIKEVEQLTIEEAKFKVDEFANKGYVQTIWAFLTPHIGALCNCDYPYCTALRVRRNTGIKHALLKGEYIAIINESSCAGCKQCIPKCQFGALSYSIVDNKVKINQSNCFGCGACREACKNDAITLIPREQIPIISNYW
jgi:ferredoxin